MKYAPTLILFALLVACQAVRPPLHSAEQQIVQTLKNETRYFCERNLPKWEEQWSHGGFVSKMYAGNTEFVEFSSWQAIRQNTIDHIRNHPAPIQLPDSSVDYRIEHFGNTAWVFYAKQGPKGPIRETRFMVKENGIWKIARMQTIY